METGSSQPAGGAGLGHALVVHGVKQPRESPASLDFVGSLLEWIWPNVVFVRNFFAIQMAAFSWHRLFMSPSPQCNLCATMAEASNPELR